MAEAATPSGRPGWLLALPTAVTLGNALCGFFATVVLAVGPSDGATVALASWLIVGAWVCDMGDGMVARMTGTSGPFGAALDSLCDVVGFGVAPAFLVGTLVRLGGGPAWLGWGAAGFLLACVLVRLARFDAENVGDDGPDGHMWFKGFPSPAVGMVVAALGLAFAGTPGLVALPPLQGAVTLAAAPVGVLVGILAVTTLPYRDLPKHYLKGTAPRWQLAALAAAVLAFGPGVGLLGFFGLYAASTVLGRR